MKKSRLFTLILSLVLVMAMLSGCISNYVVDDETPAPTKPTEAPGPQQTDPNTPPTEAPTEAPVDLSKVTLSVWYAVSGTSGEKFTAMSDAFKAETGITLNLSYSGNSSDTATKVSAALLSGTQPDVALMYAGPLYTGGRGDYTVDTLMNGADFDKNDIFPGMLDYCTYMGEGICAVPFGISTQVMFYNKDLMKANGIDMTNPPKTWAEFYTLCKELVDKTGGYAFDTTDEAWLFKSMLMQNGCEVVLKENDTIVPIYNNEKAKEVAEYWKSLVDNKIMNAGKHSAAENDFLAGKLPFIAASSNRISRWTGTTTFELGAIEMPYFNQPSLALGGNVMVILTNDPVKVKAAWEYIKALTSVENNSDFALATGYLPIHKSALEQDNVKKAIAENEMYAVAFKQLDYTWAYTHFEQMGTMDSLLKTALNRLEKGKDTPQGVLDKAVNDLITEINEG